MKKLFAFVLATCLLVSASMGNTYAEEGVVCNESVGYEHEENCLIDHEMFPNTEGLAYEYEENCLHEENCSIDHDMFPNPVVTITKEDGSSIMVTTVEEVEPEVLTRIAFIAANGFQTYEEEQEFLANQASENLEASSYVVSYAACTHPYTTRASGEMYDRIAYQYRCYTYMQDYANCNSCPWWSWLGSSYDQYFRAYH